MNDINLLRYHNRSAHEINMLLNGEMNDKFFSRVVLGETKERTGLPKLVLFMTITASFICALFASYVLYNVVDLNSITIPKIDKEMIKQKVAEYQLELRTGGDPYLKDGYTRIAIVDKAKDEPTQPVVVISEYEPPIDKESKPELFTKPVELTGEPEKRKRDKRVLVTPMYTGNYTIQFLDINEAEANDVKVLVKNNDFNLNVIGSTKKTQKHWMVYKDDSNSRTVIAGKNVSYIKTFDKQDDAVKYLQKHKLAGVVAGKTTYFNYYDMEVCCLGEEAAEKLANGSGVSRNKIKILKK